MIMDNWMKTVKDSWNETSDSNWYKSLRSDEKLNELVRDPASAFHPDVYNLITKYIPDFNGKKILLPSSGDNHAAFAFSLLGADVTSVDISERQLENASEVATKLGLSIRFVCDDTMHLDSIENTRYDLVYTSNGTHAWITDLNSMYSNIGRVLMPSGYSIMYDIHPFNRPFTGVPWEAPEIKKSYFDFEEHRHWRVQDLLNAMSSSDLCIKEVAELQAVNASFWFSYDDLIKQKKEDVVEINDWNSNPMAALPAWFSVVAQKSVRGHGNEK